MRSRAMFGDCAGRALGAPQSRVAGDATATMKGLDHGVGYAQLDGLTDEGIWHAVQPRLVIDVVVDVHLGLLPAREFPSRRRQRAQRRPIQRLEGRSTTALQLLERARVQLLDELRYRC